MEIAISVAIAAVAISAAIVIVARSRRQPAAPESGDALRMLGERLEHLGGLRTKVDEIASVQDNLRNSLTSLESALKGVETRVVESTGSVRDSVLRDFGEARRTLEGIKTELDARRQIERELQQSTRHIEAVIAGGRSRGRAGENILAEAFKHFPPQIVETNFRVNGRVVEYALILADEKRVPIDSKWTAVEMLEALEAESDPAARDKIASQVEENVLAKVKEVTKYIDPAVTTSWGIAAVPDAAFAVCRNTHLDAFKSRVVLMPFSQAVVYLLSLYQVHLQYCRSVNINDLEAYLGHMEQALDKLDKELENKVYRGATMVTNAYTECKRLIGEMHRASSYLKNLPAAEESPQLELPQPGSEADGDAP